MTFAASWHNLVENAEELPPDATLLTPLSRKPFRITDVQEHRILIEYREDDGTVPLQREQFQIDDREGMLSESENPTSSPLVDAHEVESDEAEREEPDISVYSDALLLIDELERNDPSDPEEMDTPALVNLYTLLSDVQRNANDLRQDVRSILLDRLHHDQPISGQYGSVQRTSRRNRSLKEEDEVLELLTEAGIERERVTSVDASKVDDALEVVELSESDLYHIEESEYVRKAEVDEENKETRLRGLKDQLAATDEDTKELQEEIEELEQRIDGLTSFDSASSFHTRSEGEP